MTSQQHPADTVPYGGWTSPIGLAQVVAGTAEMFALSADGSDLVWCESRPDQAGRVTIMRLHEGSVSELTPAPCSVRSRVNEYGGGAYHTAHGVLVFCDDVAGILKLRSPDGTIHALTAPDPQVRYGDLRVHPRLPLVLAVREDHHRPGEPEQTIVAIGWPRADGSPGPEHVLCRGADFYAHPELSIEGQLAWVEWQHPAMPWDCALLKVGKLTLGAYPEVRQIQILAGTVNGGVDGMAIQHPRWLSNGDLVFLCDDGGYTRLHRWRAGQVGRLHTDESDFALPLWNLGNHAWAELSPDALLISSFTRGLGHLAIVSTAEGITRRLAGVSHADSICSSRGVGYALVDRPLQPRSLVRVGEEGRLETIRTLGPTPDRAYTSVARSLEFTGRHGPVQAWYYPPTNADFVAPGGSRPPLLLRVHGGPTAMAHNGYQIAVQFWTARGFAVLDVNYSGSAGFGRQWRNRLRGLWGVADVDDCVDAAEAAIDAGLADPGKVAITGSSAGGFTALCALTGSNRFTAGISRYGVTDVAALARATHKFEAHYTDSLIGPWPAAEQVYRQRSPINNLARLASPILILQGDADQVVPLDQATTLAAAARARGLPMALLVFDGEGHGFRQAQTRQQALAAEFSFLAQVFNIPAHDLPRLAIENLPANEPIRLPQAP